MWSSSTCSYFKQPSIMHTAQELVIVIHNQPCYRDPYFGQRNCANLRFMENIFYRNGLSQCPVYWIHFHISCRGWPGGLSAGKSSLHCTRIPFITLYYITLHYYITLQYTTLHCKLKEVILGKLQYKKKRKISDNVTRGGHPPPASASDTI